MAKTNFKRVGWSVISVFAIFWYPTIDHTVPYNTQPNPRNSVLLHQRSQSWATAQVSGYPPDVRTNLGNWGQTVFLLFDHFTANVAHGVPVCPAEFSK